MKSNALAAFVLFAVVHGAAGAQARVDWQLANNFPFFKSREALQAYVATAAQGVAANGKVQDAPNRKLPEGFLDQVASVDKSAELRAIFHRDDQQVQLRWTGAPGGWS